MNYCQVEHPAMFDEEFSIMSLTSFCLKTNNFNRIECIQIFSIKLLLKVKSDRNIKYSYVMHRQDMYIGENCLLCKTKAQFVEYTDTLRKLTIN